MNKTKSSGVIRLIAFFLVTVVLLCSFGFSADGWQIKQDNAKNNNVTINSNGGITSPNDEKNETDNTNTPEIYIPEFTSYLTGLEISKERSTKRPIAFVLGGSSPLYGISLSDLLIELPVENGGTRIVSITSDLTNAWKIGSLAQTRGYISNVGSFFDAIIASSGKDDSIPYDSCDTAKDELMLSVDNSYCYSEYSYYLYTNVNLINSALSTSQITATKSPTKEAPYTFPEFGAPEIRGDKSAYKVSVVYSPNSVCEFQYSKDTGDYTMIRNGNTNNDLLTNSTLRIKNCFILFTDSVTYEGTSGSQTVMNTIGAGIGYYITNGSVIEMEWSSDADGNFYFFDKGGDILEINRGKSYIGFVKSSRPEFVDFS